MSKVIELKPKPVDEWKVLAEVTKLDGKRILEVGCRDGSFGDWLKNNYKEVVYTGIDKDPDRILQGKKRYPMLDLNCENISQYEKDPFDVVFCQNLFKSQIVMEDVKAIIAYMLKLSNVAVAFTFEVQWESKEHSDGRLRPSLWEIADYVSCFTPYIQMRTDWSDKLVSFGLYRGLDKKGKVLTLG